MLKILEIKRIAIQTTKMIIAIFTNLLSTLEADFFISPRGFLKKEKKKTLASLESFFKSTFLMVSFT